MKSKFFIIGMVFLSFITSACANKPNVSLNRNDYVLSTFKTSDGRIVRTFVFKEDLKGLKKGNKIEYFGPWWNN